MSQEMAACELKDLQPSSTDHVVRDPEPLLSTQITQPRVRQGQAIIVILQLTAVAFLTSISTGLMTVSVPWIASDLDIQPQLYYW